MDKLPSKIETVINYLLEYSIEYTLKTHSVVETMDECTIIAKQMNCKYFKNLFLCNRQKTEYFLLLIAENKQFRTADVSKKIGKARLSFGDSDKLYEYLGVCGGAITPLGLIFDTENKVQVIIDSEVLTMDELLMHPLVNTATIKLRVMDMMKIIKQTGHEPVIVEI